MADATSGEATTPTTSSDSGPGSPVAERWEFETEEDATTSSPTVLDGTVYVGSRDTDLYAPDAADGSESWRRGTGRCPRD